jgi:hypothetical protein
MRRLIVSSLVSVDGIHGDPQSWVGTALVRPGRRTNLRLVAVSERRNGVVTLSYASA